MSPLAVTPDTPAYLSVDIFRSHLPKLPHCTNDVNVANISVCKTNIYDCWHIDIWVDACDGRFEADASSVSTDHFHSTEANDWR